MSRKEFTPALGYSLLMPIHDLAVGLLNREWRRRSNLGDDGRLFIADSGSISLYTASARIPENHV